MDHRSPTPSSATPDRARDVDDRHDVARAIGCRGCDRARHAVEQASRHRRFCGRPCVEHEDVASARSHHGRRVASVAVPVGDGHCIAGRTDVVAGAVDDDLRAIDGHRLWASVAVDVAPIAGHRELWARHRCRPHPRRGGGRGRRDRVGRQDRCGRHVGAGLLSRRSTRERRRERRSRRSGWPRAPTGWPRPESRPGDGAG